MSEAATKLYTARRCLVFGILCVILGAIGLVQDSGPWLILHLGSLLLGVSGLAVAARYYYLRNLTRKGISE